MLLRTLLLSSLALTPAILTAQTPVAPEYNIIDLGGLGHTGGSGSVVSLGKSINNAGQVVGEARTTDNLTRATLFSGTGSNNTNLGTISGNSSANAINDLGQIVGESRNANNNLRAVIFHSSGAAPTDLGTLGGTSSNAYDINNSGQIVGYARTAANQQIATLFSGTGSNNTSLGTLDGGSMSFANSINDLGVIVGSSSSATSGGMPHATVFSSTGNTDLGLLPGGTMSGANVINNVGQIVGGATNSDNKDRAALYTSPTNVDLGTLGGATAYAVGLNDIGQIVGSSTPAVGMSKAYLLTGGSMNQLLTLATTSAAAQGITELRFDGGANKINNWGQIAATAYFSAGSPGGEGYRAVLLNPVHAINTLSTTGSNVTNNAKLIGGMSYTEFQATTSSDNSITARFLGGIAGSGGTGTYGSNRDLNVTLVLNGETPHTGTFGAIADVTGTQGDTFVLALQYDQSSLISLFGSEDATLGWWNGNAWVNAVEGNEGESGSQFIEGSYQQGYALGTYGIDKENNLVWAVLDHNSEFVIMGGNAVPEPSIVCLGFLGFLLLFRRSRTA